MLDYEAFYESALRSRLEKALGAVEIKGRLVMTSADGIVARFAAAEAGILLSRQVSYLIGGTMAWSADGRSLAAGDERLADKPDDMWLRPYDRKSGIADAMNAYLAWELDLVDQIEEDGTTDFQLFR